MPAPQGNLSLVEQASCLFLTMVQHLSFNRLAALMRGFKPLRAEEKRAVFNISYKNLSLSKNRLIFNVQFS